MVLTATRTRPVSERAEDRYWTQRPLREIVTAFHFPGYARPAVFFGDAAAQLPGARGIPSPLPFVEPERLRIDVLLKRVNAASREDGPHAEGCVNSFASERGRDQDVATPML